MASFAEFLAESFYSEVSLRWDLVSGQHAVATFTVSTVQVRTTFEQKEPAGAWHVGFSVERGEASERTYLAFHIFNGVFQAVREFVEVREPEVVVFATKRDGLASIYETYLRREKAALERLGYDLGEAQRIEPYVEFTLRRVRPSGWRPV